ncbi:hypothetical protein IV203_003529 [Nitzschia inconspicua]|uniref:Uncharacterized protein n=1 Tax=Nitzschia inconspicua TaxID=303405 RepID=A0A9K3L201_9STRA|nr:hypothetical protein IV203_003529 [Nitzschia inconspicua]
MQTQLPVNESTRSPTASLNDTVAQSICSSMVETIEASDLLEELLSASDYQNGIPPTSSNRIIDKKRGSDNQETATMGGVLALSEDDQRQGLGEYSIAKIMIQSSSKQTLQNPVTMIPREVANSYLFNQTISFPQPSLQVEESSCSNERISPTSNRSPSKTNLTATIVVNGKLRNC